MERSVALCWFVISPVLSHILVGVALLLVGRVQDPSVLWILSGFLLVQVAILAFLVIRLKGVRLPAISLSVFGISYALFSAYVGGLALTNSRL